MTAVRTKARATWCGTGRHWMGKAAAAPISGGAVKLQGSDFGETWHQAVQAQGRTPGHLALPWAVSPVPAL